MRALLRHLPWIARLTGVRPPPPPPPTPATEWMATGLRLKEIVAEQYGHLTIRTYTEMFDLASGTIRWANFGGPFGGRELPQPVTYTVRWAERQDMDSPWWRRGYHTPDGYRPYYVGFRRWEGSRREIDDSRLPPPVEP